MVKSIYILLVVCYLIIILTYLFRYEISYRLVNTRPEVIEKRDFTYQEHKALKRAVGIRKGIGSAMLIFSMIIAVVSLLILYYRSFDSVGLVKVVIIVSSAWVLYLSIASAIRFIPTPPIR